VGLVGTGSGGFAVRCGALVLGPCAPLASYVLVAPEAAAYDGPGDVIRFGCRSHDNV